MGEVNGTNLHLADFRTYSEPMPFWIAVPIHAAQMFILDFWCTLRIRTGVSGTGAGAFVDMLKAWLGGG